MFRYTFPLWLLISSGLVVAQPPAELAENLALPNDAIYGPTDDLLPPFLATRVLHGPTYFEWCLRWNKSQNLLAAERKHAPRSIGGTTNSRFRHLEGVNWGSIWRSAGTSFSDSSTSRSREEVWEVGGYGGGPVTIYNPFVAR